ncbi:hypothetical protein [Lignipirellula cremea]|uniref:Uncharacterized protein n=1 Tax=Lignipirellula cremea TaxID=2528010 RepID=A0A518DU82_9BACT|nr:hypothetical protein [Lignipirellula cremea]QDU95391.1 hypothetical protein Pla8534_32060 [Lignipirellula cremea]
MSDKIAATEIQEEMRRVRSELREDVREVVGGAKVMSDWRHYVRNYPWLCVGAAVGLGYLATPNRTEIIQPDAKTLAQLAKRHRLVVEQDPTPHQKQSLAQNIFGFVANMAVRGAMGYAGQQLGKLLEPPANSDVERQLP